MKLLKYIALIIAMLTVTIYRADYASAREPGIGPAFPAGLTLGIPTGALPPPGTYVLQRFNYSTGEVVDNKGNGTGTNVDAFVESTQINFVTDWKILGARYMAFVALPVMVELDVDGAPAGNGTNSGFLNPILKHVLSWDLGNGFHGSVGMANYFMFGNRKQSPNSPTVAPPFEYILEPELALSYLSKDWHFTGQAVFNINGQNEKNGYDSGDQVKLNFAAIRNFGKLSVGATATYETQISSDKNDGNAFGGAVFDDAEAFALGAHVSYKFDKFITRFNYTKNIYSRNTVDEENFWMHIEFKLP